MSDFALDISKFVEKTKLDLKTVTRKIMLDVFVRVILRTPVDTGRARGNWQTTLGSPAAGEIDRKTKVGGGAPASEAAAIVATFPGDGYVYLTNNVPYILPLEYGSSGQAPAGMVRITLAEYQRFVDEAVKSL